MNFHKDLISTDFSTKKLEFIIFMKKAKKSNNVDSN